MWASGGQRLGSLVAWVSWMGTGSGCPGVAGDGVAERGECDQAAAGWQTEVVVRSSAEPIVRLGSLTDVRNLDRHDSAPRAAASVRTSCPASGWSPVPCPRLPRTRGDPHLTELDGRAARRVRWACWSDCMGRCSSCSMLSRAYAASCRVVNVAAVTVAGIAGLIIEGRAPLIVTRYADRRWRFARPVPRL